jgi:Nif-specific regulatory protein
MTATLTRVKGETAEKEYLLPRSDETRLGRGTECEIQLQDPLSSRVHAKLQHLEGRWTIQDAGSRNGTQVNGSKIDQASLHTADRVRIGNTEFIFSETSTLDTATVDGVDISQTLVQNASLLLEKTNANALFALRDKDRADHLLDLYQLALNLLSAKSVDETFDLGIDVVKGRTEADVIGAFWADAKSGLRPQRISPPDGERLMQLSRKLTQKVAKEGQAIWLKSEDLDKERAARNVAEAIVVPMLDDSKTIGAIHVYRELRPFDTADFDFIISATKILTTAFLRARDQAQLVVSHDRLVEKSAESSRLLGDSEPMVQLKTKIARVGHASGCVLVRGESGAGKELVARGIHAASLRADRSLLCVNCAAIPPELMESQLFGHKKGAFTGADKDHSGWFQQADTGTLFLDEVGEMNLEGQAKLLRVLEGHPFLPVGATQEIRVDVRVVAATNRDLKDLVREKLFREDLFYRLSVFEIYVPPLRERGPDIRMLIEHFFEHFCRQNGRHDLRIGTAAMKRLVDYRWPGNIRQLRNVIDSTVVMATGPEILPSDLGLHDVSEPTLDTLKLSQWEEHLIREALRQTNSNISKAIELLGTSRATLYRKLETYKIDRDDP